MYVPQIDGTVAHATAMAVDAYVEAEMAKECAISLFDDTTSTYITEDNKTAKINKIAQIAESGTEYEKQMALSQIATAKMAMEQVAGAAAVLDAAAGGLTAAQATGVVLGGIDCCAEIGRTEAKIILGDDHKLVQAIENSTAIKTYDTAMFIYGVATFDPKSATTGEKLLFLKDLVEKDIDAYQNIKVLTDEATGLAKDRIDGETKEIAVEYMRIESEIKSKLGPAAQAMLGEDNTGIIGIDSTLDDGTVEEQMQDFTSAVQSDDLSLVKTYSRVKDGDKTLNEKISEFKDACDQQVAYESPKKASDDEGGGGAEGSEGSEGGGSSYKLNLPEPTMDYDEMETEYFSDTFSIEKYYKDGKLVGRVEYAIDEHRRYWPTYEEWRSDNGDSLITQYYQKDEVRDFRQSSSTGAYENDVMVSITAKNNGAVKRRYGRHVIETENSWGTTIGWHDIVEYYPTGQIAMLDRRSNGRRIERYDYAPNGRLYEYQTNWDDNFLAGYYLNSYTYFVYPVEYVPFDPTGHIMEIRSDDNWTAYVTGSLGDFYGYYIFYGDNYGYDYNNYGWESVMAF